MTYPISDFDVPEDPSISYFGADFKPFENYSTVETPPEGITAAAYDNIRAPHNTQKPQPKPLAESRAITKETSSFSIKNIAIGAIAFAALGMAIKAVLMPLITLLALLAGFIIAIRSLYS